MPIKTKKKHCRKTKKKFMKGGNDEMKHKVYNAPKPPKVKWYKKISRIWKSPEKVAIEKNRFNKAHKIKIGVTTHEAVNLHKDQLPKVTIENIAKLLKQNEKREKLKQQLQITR